MPEYLRTALMNLSPESKREVLRWIITHTDVDVVIDILEIIDPSTDELRESGTRLALSGL